MQSQVFLKIEDYLLICAPFQLSMKRGIFLVVLSAQEITFFQQFQKKLCSINLTFQKTGSKKPLNLLLRGTLERIGPVKGKQNVCMMDAAIKACPNDLVEIIGDYITAFEGLKSQYENFSGKAIPVDEHAAKLMRFNNYVELVLGATQGARHPGDPLREHPLRRAVRRSPGPGGRERLLGAAVLPGLPVHRQRQGERHAARRGRRRSSSRSPSSSPPSSLK